MSGRSFSLCPGSLWEAEVHADEEIAAYDTRYAVAHLVGSTLPVTGTIVEELRADLHQQVELKTVPWPVSRKRRMTSPGCN